jgi:hypothetical protein
MAIRIMDDAMTLETGNCVVATARFSEHATADGNGVGHGITHVTEAPCSATAGRPAGSSPIPPVASATASGP